MDIYLKKERIILSRTTRKRYIEVFFENSDAIRLEFFDREDKIIFYI